MSARRRPRLDWMPAAIVYVVALAFFVYAWAQHISAAAIVFWATVVLGGVTEGLRYAIYRIDLAEWRREIQQKKRVDDLG